MFMPVDACQICFRAGLQREVQSVTSMMSIIKVTQSGKIIIIFTDQTLMRSDTQLDLLILMTMFVSPELTEHSRIHIHILEKLIFPPLI